MRGGIVKKWIYMTDFDLTEDELDELGAKGWELCAVTNTEIESSFFFKQELLI